MTDPTRLLAARSEHGYTDRPSLALEMEPEAISEEEQRLLSLQSRTGWAEERKDENRRRDNHQWLKRLEKAEHRAASSGIDIFRYQAVIRREILAIEQRLSGRGTFLGGSLVSA